MKKMQKFINIAIVLILFFVSLVEAIPTEESINKGLLWIKANQNSDGSWNGKPESIVSSFQSTTTVVNTLFYVDDRTESYNKRINWIINKYELEHPGYAMYSKKNREMLKWQLENEIMRYK